MSKNHAQRAKGKNDEDLERAREDADEQRLKRSWIARERALADGSPTLIGLMIGAAQGVGHLFASPR